MAMTGWKALMLTSLILGSTEVGAQPIVRLFELHADPGRQEAFDAAGRRNLDASLQTEPGVLAMHAVTDRQRPGVAYVFEIYADADALKTHLATAHYADFLRATQPLITDKTLTETTPVFLAEKPDRLSVMQRGNTPEVRMVDVTVKPADIPAFTRIVTAEMRESMRIEPGVLAMYAVTRQDHPEQWIFFEIYADAAAYDMHRQTPHFKDYLQRTAEMLVDKGHSEVSTIALKSRGDMLFDATDMP
jgi:quinol monooxygenase YgiN